MKQKLKRKRWVPFFFSPCFWVGLRDIVLWVYLRFKWSTEIKGIQCVLNFKEWEMSVEGKMKTKGAKWVLGFLDLYLGNSNH